jgi:hypothetical protein
VRRRWTNPFTTEAEIATLTRSTLESIGWIVHPETGGFDLLAVATERVRMHRVQVGDVLGVECKLDAGTLAGVESLLRQTLPKPPPPRWQEHEPEWNFYAPSFGVHWRAAVSARFRCAEIFRRWGVAPVEAATYSGERHSLESFVRVFHLPGIRFRPAKTPWVPEVVIDVPAGVPSPQTSSAWKVAAVRTMLRLEAGELLTSEDFRAVGLNPGTFSERKWIADSGKRKGRSYLWTVGLGKKGWGPPPHLAHPEIAAALRAKDAADLQAERMP